MNVSPLSVFALVMLAGVATPGPTVLLALSNASRFGIRRASFGTAGTVAADVTLVGVLGLGLGALLATSEILFVTLKWQGTCVASLCRHFGCCRRIIQLKRSRKSIDCPQHARRRASVVSSSRLAIQSTTCS
jgi:hypothetical protein